MSLPVLLLLPRRVVMLALVLMRCLLRAMHIGLVDYILPWLLAVGAVESIVLPQLPASSAFPWRSFR